MTLTPQALDDPQRLQAVADLGLVGQPFEERFDRVTRTAQRVLDVPLAFLNLVAGDALWVTSCVGFDERQVDRNVAFCSHAIASPVALLVPDTTADDRFRDNPLVVDAPRIRAYAGRPLRGPSGHVVGTLCAMDLRPRAWSPAEAAALEDLAEWAETELARGDVERRLAEGELLRRQHEQVLTHAGQGIVGVDADGTVVVANPAACRLAGGGDTPLVGQPLHDVLHAVDADGHPCVDPHCPLVRSALGGVTALRERLVLRRRDGSALPAQVSSAPIRDGDVVTGAVVVLDDVSEQQVVERMKDEFVSVVSHELRTPLTALRGSLGLLAAGVLGPLSEQGTQMAGVAVSSTERLVRLVDDILDLERLIAGRVVLRRGAHDLREVATAATDAVAAAAAEAGVRVHVEVQPGEAWLDAERVAQVLARLLGNGVKFSDAGSVVDLRITHAPGALVLEVEDRGRGIPPDQLDRVFERFAQVDASDTRDQGGTGLGLAIARSLVEAHGGSLSARSAVGVGTTFTMTLPQRRPDPQPQPAGRRRDDQSAT